MVGRRLRAFVRRASGRPLASRRLVDSPRTAGSTPALRRAAPVAVAPGSRTKPAPDRRLAAVDAAGDGCGLDGPRGTTGRACRQLVRATAASDRAVLAARRRANQASGAG